MRKCPNCNANNTANVTSCWMCHYELPKSEDGFHTQEKEQIDKETTTFKEPKPIQLNKTWKPVVAGGLMILSALTGGIYMEIVRGLGLYGAMVTLPIIIAGVGAVGAFKRKWWGWAITGAGCSIIINIIFGIPAFVLLLRSKNEFR